MSDGYERGVVVDPEGFFIAAVKWETGTPAPDMRERATPGGKSVALVLLRDQYAIDNVETNARWDFTPVREDGVLVRAGTWTYPTEERWLVNQRRDIPDLWVLSSKRKVWPDRLPRLPDGSKLVSVEPPSLSAAKPIWSDNANGWLTPRNVVVCGADGVVMNRVVSYVDEDIPTPDGGWHFMHDPEGRDERGKTMSVEEGDHVAQDGTVTVRRVPRYNKVPTRLFEQALNDQGLLSAFGSFLIDKGYTPIDILDLGEISLNNKLIREFVLNQGFTIEQAYTTLQQAAEAKHAAEMQKKNDLGEEEL